MAYKQKNIKEKNIVAVKVRKKVEFYEFPNKTQKNKFINDLKELNVEYVEEV